MNNKKSNFFALMSRMKYISRWGLMRNSFPENIEGHSLQVAMIAHALALIKNIYFEGELNPERIAVYAMYHDADEILTGDMPTPVKYHNPEINEAYKNVEDLSKDRIVSLLPEEMQEFYREIFFYEKNDTESKAIVKAADKLSAYIKCLEELNAGNSEFQKASVTIKKALTDMKMPEVDLFIDCFMNGFKLTLDEIKL